MEFDRAQLKRSAKQAMKHQRPRPMLITLLFSVLVGIGTQIVNGILRGVSGSNDIAEMYAYLVVQQQRDPLSAIQYMLVYFGPGQLALTMFVGFVLAALIIALWSDFMRTGYSNFCLGMVRREQPETAALFSHLPQWGSVLFTKFLVRLFRTLWELLLGVGPAVIFVAMLLFGEREILMMLVILAAYTAYSLGVMWFTLRYAMVDFLIADRGLTGMDAIRESKRLVRENGNTGKLFILELSFLNWYLVKAAFFVAAVLAGMVMFGPEIEAAMGTPAVLGPMIASTLGFIGLLVLAMIAASIFDLWLTPYVTGAEALFYDWTQGMYHTRPAGGIDGGQGGWGQPYPPQQPAGYTRSSGPSSGTGIGPGPQNGGGAPRSPKPPRDDPWD